MEKQTIGEFLAALRKANGYTQQEVADRLGVSNRTVSAWECGTVMPDILLLPQLAELYGVTCDEILHGERAEKEPAAPPPQTDAGILPRFTMQACIVTGIFCTGLILFFIGLMNDEQRITWVGWQWWLLVLYLGLATVIVSVACLVAFWKGAELKGANDACLCLVLRKRFSVCVAVAALLSLVLAAVGWFSDVDGVGLAFSVLTVALLVFGGVIYHNGFQKWGSDEDKADYKQNVKRCAKIFGWGLIPVGLACLGMIVFTVWYPTSVYELYRNSDKTQFIQHMETLHINDGREYPLALTQLSQTATSGEEIDLGGGITCVFDEDMGGCDIQIRESEGVYSRFRVDRIWVDDGSFSVYNAQYALLPYMVPVNEQLREFKLEQSDGVYIAVAVNEYDYSQTAYVVGGAVILVDLLVCGFICIIKK